MKVADCLVDVLEGFLFILESVERNGECEEPERHILLPDVHAKQGSSGGARVLRGSGGEFWFF